MRDTSLSSFFTRSMRDTSFACATRALTRAPRAGVGLAVADSILVNLSRRARKEIANFCEIPSVLVIATTGLIRNASRRSIRTGRAHAPLLDIPRSPSPSPSSSFFFFSLRRDPGGRKICVGHVHSSHGEECDVNYLTARSQPSARERASERARTHARPRFLN